MDKPEEKKPDDQDEHVFDNMMKALESVQDMKRYEQETEVILLQSAVNYFSLLSFNLVLRTLPAEQRKMLFNEALAAWKKGVMAQGHEDAQRAHEVRTSPMGKLLSSILPDEEAIVLANANAVKKIEDMMRKGVLLEDLPPAS
jgi:hypothetical protein